MRTKDHWYIQAIWAFVGFGIVIFAIALFVVAVTLIVLGAAAVVGWLW